MIQSDWETSFEYWFFKVATEEERNLSPEKQSYGHQVWLAQESNWQATQEELSAYETTEEDSDPLSS